MNTLRITTLLVASAMLAACSRPAVAPEPVRAVRTMTIASDRAGGVHEYAAEVRARTESRLSFRVPGKMLRRPAELGMRVKAGQVLAELDPADLRLQQAAAAAALKSAQVNLELARADFGRYKDLRDKGFISAAELERRETTLKAAEAGVEQARAQAEVQGNQTDYAVLRAAVPGVITGIDAEPGAVLAAGAPVLRLAHDGPRDVVFSVPEDALGGVAPLVGRRGALRVRLWGREQTLPATVREVAAAADPVTRTFLVKADVGDAAVELGQTAAVLIDLPPRDGVARLPLSAVTQQQGRTAVWLVDAASMTVQLQPVVVAGADQNSVVVASGLQPGQIVVTAGVHVLTPGQKVKWYQAPAGTGR